MPHLTKRLVDAERPREKEVLVWDDQLKGFGLRIMPSGVKSFILQYRTKETARSRRMTIGRYGTITPEQARARARQLLGLISSGSDPLGEIRSRNAQPNLATLLDRYLVEHVLQHNAPSTAKEIKRLVELHVRPSLGHFKVFQINRDDIATLHKNMSETPRQANLVLSIISKMLNLAEEWGLRAYGTNPARRIKRYRESARDRFLTDAELERLGQSLALSETVGLPWRIKSDNSKHLQRPELRRTPVSKPALLAIRLLLFTGARLSEILTLQWQHVDLDAGKIALPFRKGEGRRFHPVSKEVNGILSMLSARNCSRWVLPRDGNDERHVSKEVVESAWQRIRHHAGIDDVRLHDLRHTVATYASGAGGNAFLIAQLLRHNGIAMTSRYVSSDHDPIRAISEVVSARITAGLSSATLPKLPGGK